MKESAFRNPEGKHLNAKVASWKAFHTTYSKVMSDP